MNLCSTSPPRYCQPTDRTDSSLHTATERCSIKMKWLSKIWLPFASPVVKYLLGYNRVIICLGIFGTVSLNRFPVSSVRREVENPL